VLNNLKTTTPAKGFTTQPNEEITMTYVTFTSAAKHAGQTNPINDRDGHVIRDALQNSPDWALSFRNTSAQHERFTYTHKATGHSITFRFTMD